MAHEAIVVETGDAAPPAAFVVRGRRQPAADQRSGAFDLVGARIGHGLSENGGGEFLLGREIGGRIDQRHRRAVHMPEKKYTPRVPGGEEIATSAWPLEFHCPLCGRPHLPRWVCSECKRAWTPHRRLRLRIEQAK